MREPKTSSRRTIDGKQLVAMTPAEISHGAVQKVVGSAPGDAQKGRQTISMTPVTPSPASEERGRQPVAMTPVEAPPQTPASVPVNPTPSGGNQGPSPQAPQSSAGEKD